MQTPFGNDSSLIRERQAEGIVLATAAGKYKGRAKKLDDEQIDKARKRIAAGVPKAKIAREMKINRSTLYRALDVGEGASRPPGQ